MPGLSISDIVNVDVVLAPQATPVRNFGSLLLLGSSDIISTDERIREYTSLDGVANDFGTDAPEYLAADLFFSQNPQPSTLYVGKWAQLATSGRLHGNAASALSSFTSVSTGSMSITIDGTTKTLSGLDFSAASNLNAVASVLQTALASSATVTYDTANNCFVVKSTTTGTTSTVSFATATGSGVDVSAMTGLNAGTAVAGIAAETMLSAVQTLASKSSDWYGLAIAATGLQNSDLIAVAQYVEGAAPSRFFAVTTQESGAIDPESTTDLAASLSALKLNQTAVQYSSSSPFAAVSLFARQASVNFAANNSTITLKFKQQPGVVAETLNETQAAALRSKHANVFVNYNNSVAIIQEGTCASGQYIDSIVGLNWLQNALQTAIFNLMFTSATKVPQDDAGVNLIIATADSTLDQAVSNGLLAPGVWTGPAIGPLQTGQTLSKGYLVWAPSVDTQSSADRAARKSPPIQVAVKLGGAIHSVDVVVNVSQ